MTEDAIEILRTSETSAAALIRLLAAGRKKQRLSTARVCKRMGLSSAGNLSDIKAGRRRLAVKHIKPLQSLLTLSAEEAHCLKLLVLRDREGDAKVRQKLTRKLLRARRILMVPTKQEGGAIETAFQGRVLAAFGLTGGSCKLGDLLAYFGKHEQARVEAVLQTSIASGVVTLARGVYQLNGQFLVFKHIQHAQSSIESARAAVEANYENRDLAIFQSITLAANKSAYVNALQRLRILLADESMKLCAEEPDMIVNFNVQIYPTLPFAPK